MDPRAAAIRRVVHLAQVTQDRGATAAEEEAATRRAERIIERYCLTYAECAEAEAELRLAQGPRPRVPFRPQPAHAGGTVTFGFGQTGSGAQGVWVRVTFG